MKTTISKRGFSILKEDLDQEEIIELKKTLTVKPFINGDYGVAPKSFPVFCESIKKFYIPRFYGQKKYGLPSESKLNEPKSINIEFSKSLKASSISFSVLSINSILFFLNNSSNFKTS